MNDIYFVYLGEYLPKYAISSLLLAGRNNNLRINLIGSSILKKDLNLNFVNFIACEDFYDPSEFDQVKSLIKFSHSFRGGFWLKTLERFFVLEQFLNKAKLSSIFHAELDQLLFRADLLLEELEKVSKEAIFIPFHDSNRAVPSIFFCNSNAIFRKFIEFSLASSRFNNEMELIRSWAQVNNGGYFALPTVGTASNKTIFEHEFGVNLLTTEKTGGFVDAAQLGQWIAGIDPKNVSLPKLPKTKFADEPSEFLLDIKTLNSLKFNFEESEKILSVKSSTFANTRLYNLHLHSKTHNWFARSRNPEKKILNLSNRRRSKIIPDALGSQLSYILSEFFRNTKYFK